MVTVTITARAYDNDNNDDNNAMCNGIILLLYLTIKFGFRIDEFLSYNTLPIKSLTVSNFIRRAISPYLYKVCEH